MSGRLPTAISVLWAFGFVILFASCSEEESPPMLEDVSGTRLTHLSSLMPPLVWSEDGNEIYAVEREQQFLLAVDVRNGSTRTFGEGRRRVVPVPGGIAYCLLYHTEEGQHASSVHLIRGDRDTVLATEGFDLARTRDGSRLIWWSPGSLSALRPGRVTVADLASMQTQVFEVPLQWWVHTAITNPSGDKVLLEAPWTTVHQLASLSLVDGSLVVHDEEYEPEEAMVRILGWTEAGILVLDSEMGYQYLVEGATGQIIWELGRPEYGMSSDWRGGFVDPTASRLFMWHQACIGWSVVDAYSRCTLYASGLWAFDMGTRTSYMVARVILVDNGGWIHRDCYDGYNGAVSPDGRTLAYVFRGDIHLSALP